MGRKPRIDSPGMVFHVMNRAIAHRPAFETRADIRYFLALTARATRRFGIAVEAFTVLTTHFHALVRSNDGRISEAMGWIEQRYTTRFNRRRERDGPLFRGRFVSRHVDSREYWHRVVKYIDHNAVAASIVRTAVEYPYSSAACYMRRKGPPWLSRFEVEETIRQVLGYAAYEPVGYAEVFSALSPAEAWVVERRLHRDGGSSAALDDLMHAAPAAVREWLLRNARNADGTRSVHVLVDPAVLLADPLDLEPRDRVLLHVGLLRSCCGLALDEVAVRLQLSIATIVRREREHRLRLKVDARYAEEAAGLLSRSLAKTCLAPS